jgi:hypothetical protein
MALATGVACNKEGEGKDGGQATATRAMATMWAAAAAVGMAAAAAALLMLFPVSKFLFSFFSKGALQTTRSPSVLAGRFRQNVSCGFLFKQSYYESGNS